MIEASLNIIGIPHESEWMNADILLQWLRRFKFYVNPAKEIQFLLF